MFGPGFYRLDFPSDISLGVFRRSASPPGWQVRIIRYECLAHRFSHLSAKSIKAGLVVAEGENWSWREVEENANSVDLARRLT